MRSGLEEVLAPARRTAIATCVDPCYFPFPSGSATSFWKSARWRRGSKTDHAL
jgi:hypothetical protein